MLIASCAVTPQPVTQQVDIPVLTSCVKEGAAKAGLRVRTGVYHRWLGRKDLGASTRLAARPEARGLAGGDYCWVSLIYASGSRIFPQAFTKMVWCRYIFLGA